MRHKTQRSPVNIMRFGCPSDIIVHVPLDVARLKISAQKNLSKTQCSLQDLLDITQPPPKKAELKEKEKVIQELNSIKIPMQSFNEITPHRRIFSLGIEEEKSSDEMRGKILKRLQETKTVPRQEVAERAVFDVVTPADIEQAEASLAPYRLNAIRSYRFKSSSLFFAAVKSQSYKQVRALINETRKLVSDQDSLGLTGLHWAVKRDDLKMAELLLGWGTDVNKADMLNRTPVYLAVKKGNTRMVSLLMDHGANPSIATVSGVSSEQLAKEGSALWISLNKKGPGQGDAK